MDYKEVKKGIKRQELDKLNYNVATFGSIVAGCIVGAIAQNFFIGLAVCLVLGVMAARKYFEIGKDKDA